MFLKLQLTCKLKDEALFMVAYCELSNFCLISFVVSKFSMASFLLMQCCFSVMLDTGI